MENSKVLSRQTYLKSIICRTLGDLGKLVFSETHTNYKNDSFIYCNKPDKCPKFEITCRICILLKHVKGP